MKLGTNGLPIEAPAAILTLILPYSSSYFGGITAVVAFSSTPRKPWQVHPQSAPS